MREFHDGPWPKGVLGSGTGPGFENALGRTAVADYIAAMTNDLRSLARRNGFDTLAYLLDMAQLEADSLKASERKRGSVP